MTFVPDAPPVPPSISCRPYVVDFDALPDRLRGYGNDVRAAVAELTPEPLPSSARLAQQQFLECLDAMNWQARSEAHAAARALFDRLFWSWRSDELRIVELDGPPPYGLDSAWGPGTVVLFGQLWDALEPELPRVRPAFDRALRNGDLVGRYEDFSGYARAWGDAIRHAAEREAGLIVVQFEE